MSVCYKCDGEVEYGYCDSCATLELKQAHREGWEQAKVEAKNIIADFDVLSRSGGIVTAKLLEDAIATLEYKEDKNG